jgi:hypothetical protein
MNTNTRGRIFSGAAFAAIALALLLFSGCGPKPMKVEQTATLSPGKFSYGPWEKILATHVRDGQVDYSGIQNSNMDSLNEFLDMIARLDPSGFASTHDELAFWINAYNAFAVKAVLDGYSPGNIIGRYRFFHFATFFVGGKPLSLKEIENEILRKRFGDPRVAFAIVAAGRGYPNLQSCPYLGGSLNAMLDLAAHEFASDTSRNRIDSDNETLYLSKIYSWHAREFAEDGGTVKSCFLAYLDKPVEEKKPFRAYRVKYQSFDWNLNGTPPRSR